MLTRYALRTLWGPRLVLVLVALETANLLQRGRPWRGELLWTVEWLGIVHFVAGPLLAGVAAVDAARLARPGSLELLAVSKRPRGTYVWAAAWTAVPACVAHTAALAAALGWGQRFWGNAELGSAGLAFAVQLAGFCWYSALGSVIGRYVPVLAAGPAAAVGALGLFYRLADGDGFLLMHFGASTVSRLGVQLNAVYLWLQLAVLAGTAAMFMLPRVWPAREPMRRTPHLLGVTALAAALVVLMSARGLGPDQRQMLADPYPPDRCYGENPVVCYYPQHQRMAEPSYEAIADFAQRARQAGYHDLMPDTIHETSRSYFPTDPAIQGLHISAREYEGNPPDPADLIQTLVLPNHCRKPDRSFGDMESRMYEFHFDLVDALHWLYVTEGPSGLEFDVAEHSNFHDWPIGWVEELTPEEVSVLAAKRLACDF